MDKLTSLICPVIYGVCHFQDFFACGRRVIILCFYHDLVSKICVEICVCCERKLFEFARLNLVRINAKGTTVFRFKPFSSRDFFMYISGKFLN